VDKLLSGDAVSVEYRGCGAVRITDPVSLAASLGLDARPLTGHPLALTEDGVLVARWEVTELIVTAAVRRDPAAKLEYVSDEV
jgi:hypothetical protein